MDHNRAPVSRLPSFAIRDSRPILAALALLLSPIGCSAPPVPAPTPPAAESAALRRVRQVFARIPETLAKNHKTFDGPSGPVSGFGAGEAYPQIWLRDSAWIVDAAAAYYTPETLTSWLDLHLAHAQKNGRLRDWVARGSPDAFRQWAPRVEGNGGFAFDTNTNESDQEPSAAIAFCRTSARLSDGSASGEAHAWRVGKLIAAMDALSRDRTDAKSGLVWSGLTADWGDVSPLYPDQRAIYLDAKTPRTLSLYSNVMAYEALRCLADLEVPAAKRAAYQAKAAKLKERIRSAFWMKDRGYFRIRRPLDRAPLAFGALEDERFALGGNALAALFGVADDAEAASIFETAERLRKANDFKTVSTTLIPPYPEGTFQHPAMREASRYQNGGQWDWFGAALVQAEFERGHSQQARAHLDQIAARILRAGPGLHEWYGQDGTPQGSAAYAASAAAIHNAVVKGLFGVTSGPLGYVVTIRAGETVLPFEVPQRAAGGAVVLEQRVTEAAVEVTVRGVGAIREICTVLPQGRTIAETGSEGAAGRTVTRLGGDTTVCADVSSSRPPVSVSFALARP